MMIIFLRQIKELKENLKLYKEISKIMNIPKASVWWKNAIHCKSGPKCKILKRLSIRIKRHVEKINNKGRQVNCIQIKKELELHIERRTINN